MAKKVTRSDEKKSIFGLEVNGPVFFTSVIFIILSIGFTILFEKQAQEAFSSIQNAVAENADWFFILCINLFLVFLIYLAVGKFGKIRIGGPSAKPEFKTLSWFAMLFSAGMGIGLLFFGVAEPVQHLLSPPTAEPNTVAAAQQAMNFTFHIVIPKGTQILSAFACYQIIA